MHYAAKLGYLSMVKILFESNGYVAYIQDVSGRTALHRTAKHGHHDIMTTIISMCPDCSKLLDNKGRNILHYAVKGKSSRAISIIMTNPLLRNLFNETNVKGNTSCCSPLHSNSRFLPFGIQNLISLHTTKKTKMLLLLFQLIIRVQGTR